MRPAEWAALLAAQGRKEARARAWECRLHGLRHKSGRALTADDFLPKHLREATSHNAESVFAAMQAAFAPPPPPVGLSPRGTILTAA